MLAQLRRWCRVHHRLDLVKIVGLTMIGDRFRQQQEDTLMIFLVMLVGLFPAALLQQPIFEINIVVNSKRNTPMTSEPYSLVTHYSLVSLYCFVFIVFYFFFFFIVFLFFCSRFLVTIVVPGMFIGG